MTTPIDELMPAARGAWGATARRVLLIGSGACLAAATLLIGVGTVSDNGHAQLHGGSAAFLAAIAVALARRRGTTGLTAGILAIGLTALAIPMLIEGIGALGYDAVTQARTSELAGLHDIGLVTTSIGMLVLVAAIAAAAALVVARRSGLPRPVAILVAMAILVAGMLAIKVLVVGM